MDGCRSDRRASARSASVRVLFQRHIMPELPEVDHVACLLRRLVCGKRIASVSLYRDGLIRGLEPRRFESEVQGSHISAVDRRGKYILVYLSNGKTLIVHLRMTGSFVYGKRDWQDRQFTRLVFRFDDGSKLGYEDVRNLGVMKLAQTDRLSEVKELAELGPEPLSPEFTVDYLQNVLAQSRRSIKEFLLDQTKIAGLGNIYAAEALFRAGINPTKKAFSIARSKERLNKLHRSIYQTISGAIHSRGDAAIHFHLLDADGSIVSEGAGGERFFVYDREGEPCLVCGSKIRRIKQGARSTYYCPKCQR